MQGEIIAGAIAAPATVETDAITIDPDRLLDLQARRNLRPADDALSGLEFPINPERVAPVLRRLISPTKTRARIYDRDGVLMLDSRNLYGRGDVLRFDLPPPTAEKPGIVERTMIALPHLARSRRPAALPRTRPGERQAAIRKSRRRSPGDKASMVRDQRARRGDRLGRGAGAAFPRGARRADAVDAGRRHRPDGRRPSGSRS